MAKLLENTYRHIHIALVNELAIRCADRGLDVWAVIDAAASKPFGFVPFYPGPGVGGHCIPVDPMYLSWRARQFGGSAKFIELARDVNDAMPLYCASRVQDLLNDRGKPLNGARVLLLGVAYKPDIGDVRESPALPLIEALTARGAVVSYHDEHVASIRIAGGDTMEGVPLEDATLSSADCVVVVTNHSTLDYERVVRLAPLVFDTRNAIGGPHPNVVKL
jgi:UDP-N-acetyl-D-glucosamine dehydrogenase